ncbi:hypothetical protein [Deefgea rivuli]|uniref:hypothetical protein n=1 Tax=Deefgea rivuli TaxID=400948 RepID=UPI0004843642|nr:hypothetical protein [Deefgea rivuli]
MSVLEKIKSYIADWKVLAKKNLTNDLANVKNVCIYYVSVITWRSCLTVIFVVALFFVFINFNVGNYFESESDSISNIAGDAEVLASLLLQAQNSCYKVGFDWSEIVACSRYKGELPSEKTAAVMADLALEMAGKFKTKCYELETKEYCDKLLERAIFIKVGR